MKLSKEEKFASVVAGFSVLLAAGAVTYAGVHKHNKIRNVVPIQAPNNPDENGGRLVNPTTDIPTPTATATAETNGNEGNDGVIKGVIKVVKEVEAGGSQFLLAVTEKAKGFGESTLALLDSERNPVEFKGNVVETRMPLEEGGFYINNNHPGTEDEVLSVVKNERGDLANVKVRVAFPADENAVVNAFDEKGNIYVVSPELTYMPGQIVSEQEAKTLADMGVKISEKDGNLYIDELYKQAFYDVNVPAGSSFAVTSTAENVFAAGKVTYEGENGAELEWSGGRADIEKGRNTFDMRVEIAKKGEEFGDFWLQIAEGVEKLENLRMWADDTFDEIILRMANGQEVDLIKSGVVKIFPGIDMIEDLMKSNPDKLDDILKSLNAKVGWYDGKHVLDVTHVDPEYLRILEETGATLVREKTSDGQEKVYLDELLPQGVAREINLENSEGLRIRVTDDIGLNTGLGGTGEAR